MKLRHYVIEAIAPGAALALAINGHYIKAILVLILIDIPVTGFARSKYGWRRD